jgi:hypothetical protein
MTSWDGRFIRRATREVVGGERTGRRGRTRADRDGGRVEEVELGTRTGWMGSTRRKRRIRMPNVKQKPVSTWTSDDQDISRTGTIGQVATSTTTRGDDADFNDDDAQDELHPLAWHPADGTDSRSPGSFVESTRGTSPRGTADRGQSTVRGRGRGGRQHVG